MSWFDVDKSGLAALMEHRGKAFAIFELISNAFDASATRVDVSLKPIENVPYADLKVMDDSPQGWLDLSESFTVFGRSRRGKDAEKRGRFSLGEKLVLSLCRYAQIQSTTGTITFDDKGRRQSKATLRNGTLFEGEIRMNRSELTEASYELGKIIPPEGIELFFNNEPIERPKPIKTFTVKLPTMIADEEGNLRPSQRQTTVEVFYADGPFHADILEMGIPVCEVDLPWRLNVLQKVPLNFERNSVTDAFRRALQVAAVNAMPEQLTSEEATKPWVQETMGDSRIQPAALKTVVNKRFGERAVVANPADPMANAQAAANGCPVIHGGSLSSEAWANIRKHGTVVATSQAFPQPRPQDKSGSDTGVAACPMCGKPA